MKDTKWVRANEGYDSAKYRIISWKTDSTICRNHKINPASCRRKCESCEGLSLLLQER